MGMTRDKRPMTPRKISVSKRSKKKKYKPIINDTKTDYIYNVLYNQAGHYTCFGF